MNDFSIFGSKCYLRSSVVNIVVFLNMVFVFSSWSFGEPFLKTGKDHGELDQRHIQVTQKYFNERLKKDGVYDTGKIRDFIEYLDREKSTIVENVYQTVLFERLEIYLQKYKKSEEKAEQARKKSTIIIGFDQYLLPKIKELLELVEKNEKPELWDGLVNDFTRAYMTYFLPNARRSVWPMDIDLQHIAKKLIFNYKYKINDSNKTHAFNLMYRGDFEKKITKCLKKKIEVNHYFSQSELNKLIKCNFDISKLDPGVSNFWEEVNPKEIDKNKKKYVKYFPTKDEKIIYKRINMRSKSSPKLKAKFVRDGVEYDLKVKMGREVNTDIATSNILELVGLHQDQSQYRDKVRVYLDKDTFEEFMSALANKYSIQSISQFIHANGKDENTGEEWIEINDVMLEARPFEELRVAPFDIGGWDLQNRREFRSLILTLGWLGLQDIHPGNLKLIFRKKNDRLYPLLRLFDPGASLGGPMYIGKMKHFYSLATTYKVNAFPETFINFNKNKQELRLRWNDYGNRYRNFQYTSWYDLKWMARKILKIDKDRLYSIFIEAGMPQPVAKMYYYKLLKRRNEMIKSFSLEDEFSKDEVPNLKKINLKDEHGYVIKKGKIVKSAFPGKNTSHQVANNIWTIFPSLMKFDLPIHEWKHSSSGTSFKTGLRGLEGLKRDLNFTDYGTRKASTSFPVGIGVQAVASRRIETNSQILNANGKINLYRIVDSIKLRFAADSPMLREAIKKLPVIEGDASLRFYEKVFQHIHYHDNAKQAFYENFDVIKILKDINYYAAYKLNPMEVLQAYEKVGLEMEVGVGIYSTKPVVDNEVSLIGGIRKIRSKYIVRDQYGQLHYYLDKNKMILGGSVVDLASINIVAFSLPLLNLRMASSKFSYSLKDLILRLPETDRDKNRSQWTEERKLQEYKTLQKISNWNEKFDLPKNVEVNYTVDAKGSKKVQGLGFLFVANRLSSKGNIESKVQLPNGETKSFYRYALTSNRSKGVEKMNFDFSLFDLFIKNRKKTDIEVEMDEDENYNFVLAIRTQDYFRSRSVKKVESLIKDLNRRYSFSTKDDFYSDYILPPSDLVKKYPKVYGLTHTFLFGKNMNKSFAKIHESKVKKYAVEHFTNSWYFGSKRIKNLSLTEKISLKIKVNEITKNVKKIKKLIKHSPSHKNSKKLARAYAELMKHLKTEMYGLFFLRKVVGIKGMFVMGEVTGLLRSYSPLNTLMQLQRRRFMGKSWGTYQERPPLQNFLRKNRLVPPSAHINKTIPDSEIFGRLQTGVAPNLEPIFNHDEQF